MVSKELFATIKDKEEVVAKEQQTIKDKDEEIVEEEVVEEEVVKELLKAMQLLLSIKDVEEENVEEEDVEDLLKFTQEEGVTVNIP